MPSPPLQGLQSTAALIARRKLSPVEAVEAALETIERLNPTLNAFISVAAEAARLEARRAEVRLARRSATLPPLLGVPISVKDLILTEDAPTTAGSRVFDGVFNGGHDAPVVARLRRAGAIVIGKTNLHEVAFGVTTVNEHFGAARNPWNSARMAGGSSGGSAVAVAAGMGAASVGTDTRGSIRIPAACCGVTGLKPTFGLLPTEAVVPLAPTLDHVGPITRSAADAALMLGAMQGGRALERYRASLARKQRKVRVAVSEYYLRDADDVVVKAIEGVLRVFRQFRWEIVEAKLPALEPALEASRVIVTAEALAFHERWLTEKPNAYGPLVKSRLETGKALTAVDLVRAEEHRAFVMSEFAELFRSVDLLVGAVLPVQPPPLEVTTLEVGAKSVSISDAFCRYNAPQNLAGVPALAMPAGFARGLPLSVQLVAGWGKDAALLAAAAAFQRATDWHLRKPPRT